MWEHHEHEGQVVVTVRPGTLVDDIKLTGNDIWLWFEHGDTMIATHVPDAFGQCLIADAYTEKYWELNHECDGVLDGVDWEFTCESGNLWTASIQVERWWKMQPTETMDRETIFAVRGTIHQRFGTLRQRFTGRVDVEID